MEEGFPRANEDEDDGQVTVAAKLEYMLNEAMKQSHNRGKSNKRTPLIQSPALGQGLGIKNQRKEIVCKMHVTGGKIVVIWVCV